MWNTNHNMQNMKRSSYLGTPSLLCVSTLLPIQTCIPKDRSQKAGGQDDKCHQLSSCSAVWMETRRGHRVLRCNLTSITLNSIWISPTNPVSIYTIAPLLCWTSAKVFLSCFLQLPTNKQKCLMCTFINNCICMHAYSNSRMLWWQ